MQNDRKERKRKQDNQFIIVIIVIIYYYYTESPKEVQKDSYFTHEKKKDGKEGKEEGRGVYIYLHFLFINNGMHGTTQMEKGVTLMTPRRSAKGGNPMAQKKKKE